MLQVNPNERISTTDALKHAYFNNLDDNVNEIYNGK